MAYIRIKGISIPNEKQLCIGLQYIYGVGLSRALEICTKINVNARGKIKNLSEAELDQVRSALHEYQLEGDLRREVSLNIKRLMDIGCYRGRRLRKGLPTRGQRTKNNARTCKGKRKKK
jgi:small subunit ribosomal protein S13